MPASSRPEPCPHCGSRVVACGALESNCGVRCFTCGFTVYVYEDDSPGARVRTLNAWNYNNMKGVFTKKAETPEAFLQGGKVYVVQQKTTLSQAAKIDPRIGRHWRQHGVAAECQAYRFGDDRTVYHVRVYRDGTLSAARKEPFPLYGGFRETSVATIRHLANVVLGRA